MGSQNIRNSGLLASLCLLITACGGGGGDSTDNSGKLSVSIVDAPIYDAQAVNVNFTGVKVKPENGPALDFSVCLDLDDAVNNPPILQPGECSLSAPGVVIIDLLEQTGGASFLLLDAVDITAGKVNWIRLVLTDPAGSILLSTGEHELTVPSGNQTGLKLNRGFDVPEGGEVKIYIDFDVRKSIVFANGEYKLKPTLRLVEDFGAIAGNVDPLLRPATCLGPSIYVFAGATTTPDDIERDQGDPVSSAMVNIDTGNYRADFLEPGDYTLAFVCADGGLLGEPDDDPDRDDLLSFAPPAGKPATVVDDQTVQIDF